MKLQRVHMRDYFVLPHPQLRSYLKRQEMGQPLVFETPLWSGQTTEEVCQKWWDRLVRLCSQYPHLLEFESEMMGKVGPLSVEKPLRERTQDIEAYYSCVQRESMPIDPEYVIETWRRRWKSVRNVPMFTDEQVLAQMKLSTNSGNPYFTKRNLVIRMGKLGYAEWDGNEWYLHTPDGVFRVAAVLGWRGQEGGIEPDNVKQRVLWMFCMLMNILEARIYAPLVRKFQSLHIMPTWEGNDSVDVTMTKLFDSKAPSDYVVGTDFTKYDQHFNRDMQNCSSDALRLIFGEPSTEWRNTVFPAKYSIPLIWKWGLGSFGDHGMASGSGGTNADETLAHSVLQMEAAVRAGQVLNPYSMCLGDDGILTYPGIDVDHVLNTYTAHGQEMNPTKQSVARDHVVFLRRLHDVALRGTDGILHGIYSTERALGKLRYLERHIKPKNYGARYIINRSLSIIENCRFHPAREEFVDFVMEGDEYGLGTKIPGFYNPANFAAGMLESMAAGGFGYQYTDTLGGIRPSTSWWVYQYIVDKYNPK